MQNKKILIIDEDQNLIVQLKEKLSPLGYKVSTAINGVIALQKILNYPPNLIIMELDLKIISGVKISQIIRANPKISDTPIFFLSQKSVELDSFNKATDSLILKPFNLDEIASKVEALFKGDKDRSPDTSDLNSEISGHLSQISLSDLIQIFHMNKKSGRLIIKYADRNGVIFVKNGDVVNAKIDNIEGEKAFFRLMTLKEERFNFLPEDFMPEDSISIPKITLKPDNLLMEGLRQMDEWQEIKDNLPDLNSTVKLNIDPNTMPKDIKPISQEIFILLDFYSKVKDIVDGCSFTDYEVLRTLYIWLQKGIIEEISPKKKEKEKSFFLTPEQMNKIKKRLLETKSFRVNRKYEKIMVIGEDFKAIKKIVQMLLMLKEFSINQKDLASSPDMEFLGILGRLTLTDEMNILFYSIPALDSFKPLWNAFAQDVMGVFLLMPQNGSPNSGDIKSTYDFFKANLTKPIKPLLLTDEKIDENIISDIKNRYALDQIFSYNMKDKDGVRDFFVNLLVEIL